MCEAQLQFGVQAHVPVFGGSRGPDISKSISDIQVINLSHIIKSVRASQPVVTAGQALLADLAL